MKRTLEWSIDHWFFGCIGSWGRILHYGYGRPLVEKSKPRIEYTSTFIFRLWARGFWTKYTLVNAQVEMKWDQSMRPMIEWAVIDAVAKGTNIFFILHHVCFLFVSLFRRGHERHASMCYARWHRMNWQDVQEYDTMQWNFSNSWFTNRQNSIHLWVHVINAVIHCSFITQWYEWVASSRSLFCCQHIDEWAILRCNRHLYSIHQN